MGITIDSKKIKSKAQVDALKEAGVITQAQAKKLLLGLKAPATARKTAEPKAKQAAAKAAIAPKADKIPAGFIELDKTHVDNSFLSPTQAQAGSRLHAFAKIKSAVEFLYYYLPSDKEAPTKHAELVKTVRDLAAGVTNYMSKQQSLVEAQHHSFPAQIWSPGDVGFHPRELEPRLEKALKKFGVTLAQLPDVLREAALTIHSSESGSHNPQLRLLNAANEFEQRGKNAAYQMAQQYTPVFRVNDREGTWQLKLTPAADGQQKLDIVLRPGTKAPAKTAKAPAWLPGKLDKLEFSKWDSSLPARFHSGAASTGPDAVKPSTVANEQRPGTRQSQEKALSLARTLENVSDANRVPRDIDLADVQAAVATLRAGALDVAERVKNTRGNSIGWGGETVSAAELDRLANHLELLALRLGGAPQFGAGSTIAPERALKIYHDVAGITDANRVPRHISRKDVEDACITIQRAAPDVRDRVAGTRGSQIGWGGELVSFAGMINMAGDLATLALKMKQAGY